MSPRIRVNRFSFCAFLAFNLFVLNSNWCVWADCHTYYTDAMAILNTTTQKAARNQHPNPDAFAADFKTIVDKMQNEKCMPELMSLVQHIQAEQQKLPPRSESSKKPAPIMD